MSLVGVDGDSPAAHQLPSGRKSDREGNLDGGGAGTLLRLGKAMSVAVSVQVFGDPQVRKMRDRWRV